MLRTASLIALLSLSPLTHAVGTPRLGASKAPASDDEQSGRKLLAQARAAKGATALAKVKDLSLAGAGTLSLEGKILKISVHKYVLPGQASREETTFGTGQVVVNVVSKAAAYMKQGDKVEQLSPQMTEAMRRSLWRDPDFLLVHTGEPGARVRALPKVTERGRRFDALGVTSPDGDVVTVLLDSRTHLIARLIYVENFKHLTDTFEDYRPRAGIAFARKLTRVGEDGDKLEIHYEAIELNRGLDQALFGRP